MTEETDSQAATLKRYQRRAGTYATAWFADPSVIALMEQGRLLMSPGMTKLELVSAMVLSGARSMMAAPASAEERVAELRQIVSEAHELLAICKETQETKA